MIAPSPSFKANSNMVSNIWSPGKTTPHEPHRIRTTSENERPSATVAAPIWTPPSSPTSERKQFRPVNFQSPTLRRKKVEFAGETVLREAPPTPPPPPPPVARTAPPPPKRPTSIVVPPMPVQSVNNPQERVVEVSIVAPGSPPQVRTGQGDFGVESPEVKTFQKRKVEGIGPTTREGMPLVLRSEVRDSNQSKWYKKMYDTIHKQKKHNDEYVTIRYKQKRSKYPYTSGYLSEPETSVSGGYASAPDYAFDDENYEKRESFASTGRSRPQYYFVPQQDTPMTRLMKESGYESDSTLIFSKNKESVGGGGGGEGGNVPPPLSPQEQKNAYKVIQKGGDVPLYGLRKPAPERPKDSPLKYQENDVTIHYKIPVRQEIKEFVEEDVLAAKQAAVMRQIYEEERRLKRLREREDAQRRRHHADALSHHQKSLIPPDRYDDFDHLEAEKRGGEDVEPRLTARALYNFVGQTARELTFSKGDLIYVKRQVDKNWYEGELNAMVGLFPVSYVEIIRPESLTTHQPKRHEGQARAKYNFVAQTHLELSLAKGELVSLTKRVDPNWYEGKIGGRRGIFPVSYVEVLIEPREGAPNAAQAPDKPVASPAAHSLLLNGSAGGKESMGSHSYVPNYCDYSRDKTDGAAEAKKRGGGGEVRSYDPVKQPMTQALHIETQSEPVPYRALFKYLPQNEDELELWEGDTVYVLERCDDGWFVGSSERSGAFGTFPGNYVEKI